MKSPSLPGLLCVLLALSLPVSAYALEDQWAATLSRVAESVVSLQLSQLRNFDDVEQGGSTATGFVVDAERGIILTNRHVVGSGPIRLSATFQNQERVDAVPLYRDPIHDFAFIRFNPADLKYATPASLRLRPDKVSTGLNIRVLGSDGGEQLSILTGTIARVDREAPSYGRYGYNDFNTFYLQAASSTSGGSSGSPVVDFDGDVVALNAAANISNASSFFLPLQRIQRALRNLQENRPNTRGGLQTLFRHEPFRSLRRLGLDEIREADIRRRDEQLNGMLVVAQVLPGGVSHNLLETGDILLSIDGRLIASYLELETLLDGSIGQSLNVEVLRQGAPLSHRVTVADLHALMPDRFLELGDSILQDMSIQHSRSMNLPQSGVVLMRPGFFFTSADVPQSSIIIELDGQPVRSIDDVLQILTTPSVRRKRLVRYIVPGREFTSNLAQVAISNKWFGHRACQRVDDVRFWDCQVVVLPNALPVRTDVKPTVPGFRDPLLNRVAPAMVRVDFHLPYSADNVYAQHFTGVGLVLDAERGLILVDRNTVPIGLGDADVTFFGSRVTEAKVVFLHPVHNIALLKYDTRELSGASFSALALAERTTTLPDDLFMVGLRADGTFRKHRVDDTSRVTIGFKAPSLPRFQQTTIDVFGVSGLPPSLGGPLVDANGDVHAVWMSFAYQDGKDIKQQEWAMPAYVVAETLRMYLSGENFHSLIATLDYRPLSLADELGMPDSWLQRYLELDADQRRVLYVEQTEPGDGTGYQLEVGDVLLAIDGTLVADLFTAETLVQKPRVTLTLLRSGQVISIQMLPSTLSGLGTERIVSWAGALFQESHPEIARYQGIRPQGVYIADTADGSPALWDSMYRNRFVTAINGVPVHNLDEFLAEVSTRAQDEITRVSLLTMNGREGLVGIQPEYNFWPTFEIKRDNQGWRRVNYLN